MEAHRQPGQLLFAGFEGRQAPEDVGRLVSEGRLGGVVLFARNLGDPEQVRGLVEELHACAPRGCPLCVSIDQEGGRVQRLRAPWTEWPPMRQVGQRGSVEDTRAVAAALARELSDLRIDLDFAPVVDVDTCPDNPVIGDRSFSSDAEEVGRLGAAFVEAMQAEGVAACAKHFPGHGDTTEDSHTALPRLAHDLERLRAVELPPFRAAVEAGVASVMTAHVLIPALDPERPATLSPRAISLLRDELGYEGLIFSDDLEMKAVADHFEPREIVRGSLEAGVDAFLVCREASLRDEVLALLESTPSAQLRQPLRRMRAFKRRWSGGRHSRGSLPPYAEHQALAERLARA